MFSNIPALTQYSLPKLVQSFIISGEDARFVAHSVQRVLTEGFGILVTLFAAQQHVPFPSAYG